MFEELDEDLSTRLPGARTDTDIAGVLARMGKDEAAEAFCSRADDGPGLALENGLSVG